MLKFEEFSLEKLQDILPFFLKNKPSVSDLSAGSLFLWREDTDLGFCVWNDTLVIKQNVGEQVAFSYPMGKDPDGTIEQLLLYVQKNDLPLRFFALDEQNLKNVLVLRTPLNIFQHLIQEE